MSNIVQLKTALATEQHQKLRKEYLTELKSLSRNSKLLSEGIRDVAPDVITLLKQALADEKLTASTATTLLTKLISAEIKCIDRRIALTKFLKAEGMLTDTAVAPEPTGKARDIQKLAENALVEVASKLAKQEQTKQAQ